MRPKQGMEPCQKHVQAQRERQSHIPHALRRVDYAGASTIKPEEREFVVDSGASMHMVSKKDLNKAELETREDIEKSDDGNDFQRRGANKRRGIGVDVRELDLFVTVMLFENTLGKLCE